MTYKVLSDFLEEGHLYKKGASYPRDGVLADDERITYLMDAKANGALMFIEKTTSDADGLKVDELKELLMNAEIEFPSKANKQELIDLATTHELI